MAVYGLNRMMVRGLRFRFPFLKYPGVWGAPMTRDEWLKTISFPFASMRNRIWPAGLKRLPSSVVVYV